MLILHIDSHFFCILDLWIVSSIVSQSLGVPNRETLVLNLLIYILLPMALYLTKRSAYLILTLLVAMKLYVVG